MSDRRLEYHYSCHLQMRYMLMHEERIVRQPASFLFTVPTLEATELLLQEVMESSMYLIVFSPLTVVFSFFSPASIDLSLQALRQRFRYMPTQVRHPAKQVLESVCSKLSMRAQCFLACLSMRVSQKPMRSARPPTTCINLKSVMPSECFWVASSTVSQIVPSQAMTLRVSTSSLQRELRWVLGLQARQVFRKELISLMYLSHLVRVPMCLLRVFSAFCSWVATVEVFTTG